MSSSESRYNANNITETTPHPGRQLNRSFISSPLSVPLRFVHVPNSQRLSNTNRTPSVPDFASFYPNHYNYNQSQTTQQHDQIQHLSGEALRNADAAAEQMEQFEERLCRAQLTVLRDRDVGIATRIRSRSTPSRGASRQMRSEEEMRRRALWLQHVVSGEVDNHNPEAKEEESNIAPALHHQSADSDHIDLQGRSAASDLEHSIDSHNVQSTLPAAPTTHSLEVERSQSNEDTITSPLQNENPSSVSSSSPFPDTHLIPRPPPLPPPTSERERLVLREREARSETERARRRHLALLRERQLDSTLAMDREESGDASTRNIRPTSVGSLDLVELAGNYSRDNNVDVENAVLASSDDWIHPTIHLMQGVADFRDIEHESTHNIQVTEPEMPQSSPVNVMIIQSRGNDALRLDNLDYGGAENLINHTFSHTANSISIASVGSTSNRSGISPPPPLPAPSSERERLVLREREARIETARARRRHIALLREQNNCLDEEEGDVVNNSDFLDATLIDEEEPCDEAATQLHNNWVMERFLETLGEEERNTLTADGLTADGNLALAAESTGLTYTMELFLSETAVPGPSGDVAARVITDTEGADTEHVCSQHAQSHLVSTNQDCISRHESVGSNESDAQLVGNEITNVQSTSESHMSNDGSVEDLGAHYRVSNNIQDSNQFSQDRQSHSESSIDDAASLTINNSQSILQSADDSSELSSSTPQIPRLTEADVAQLTEVNHAIIGNAPPQFRDLGFSVATETTAIESVTETSESSIGEFNQGVVHQRSDVDQVIRVSSLRGSNVSVEAMPSIDSVVDSDSDHSHILSDSSSSELHSSPHSSELESHLSSDEESQILPPSVRDERLSESSILGRGHNIRSNYSDSIFVDQSAGLSLLDTVTANASVEAMPSVHSVHSMSQDSVDAMPSEYGHSVHEDDNETVDEDLGSSTSIEALPSLDLGSEPEESSIVSIHSNGTEDEDLLVYQASDDMARSTSIEALPSDDLRSDHGDDVHPPNLVTNDLEYGATRLNGFNHHPYAQDNFVNNQNGSERSPLLPTRHEVRDADVNGHTIQGHISRSGKINQSSVALLPTSVHITFMFTL